MADKETKNAPAGKATAVPGQDPTQAAIDEAIAAHNAEEIAKAEDRLAKERDAEAHGVHYIEPPETPAP